MSINRLSGFVMLMIATLGFQGCKDTLANLQSKPVALGRMNEIVAVSDQKVWESQAQDSLMYYYGSAYPIMPSPEPFFDIRHFTTTQLEDDALRKELRTYLILVDLGDKDSPTTKMALEDLGDEAVRRFNEDPLFFSTAGLDKWAKGQLIVYVLGKNQADLGRNIVRSFPRVSERIRKHDGDQLRAQTYMHGQSSELSRIASEKFGLQMNVPGDYKLAQQKDNFIWMRKDTRELTSNIAIRTYNYENAAQLELEGLIEMRNRLGLQIPGSTVGSFMQTNSSDLPVYTYQKEIDGRYTVESRGVWEMTEDFLGGPFVNYAIVDGNRIIMIDAFVYAPGKDKRNYIQELELVISTMTFDSQLPN